MRPLRRSSHTRSVRSGLARTAIVMAALGAVAPGGALAAGHAPIADLPGLGAAPFAADPNAIYTGVGVDGRGLFALQTDDAGDVVYYSAEWAKTVCGIRNFGLYFDTEGAPGIPVDNAGIFVEEYTITYRSGGKRYTVQAVDSAQIGLVTGADGVTRDQVTFRERVKVRRQKKGAKWCRGVHKKLFVGERVTGGA